MSGVHFYVLDGKEIRKAAGVLEWADFFEEHRVVKSTVLSDQQLKVVTIFEGIDHSFGRHPEPYLFSSAVINSGSRFIKELDDRYKTYDEAIEGHDKIVDHLSGLRPERKKAK